jgi:outer membrane protein
MKRIFLIAGIVLCGSLLRAYAQQAGGKTYTLKQCIDTGITKNLVVNQNGLQMRASEINKNQARLNMLPDLNGSATQGINQGRSIDPFTNQYINEQVNFASYQLTSGVTLFNGLSMQNANKQTAFAWQASKMDWQQAKDNLAINIILSYLTALSNEDQLAQARFQAELTTRQAQRLETLLNDGAIKPSDVSDMKGQLANDQLAVLRGINAVESAKLSLCQLMNIPYEKSMQLEKIDPAAYLANYEQSPGEIYETALKQFAQVRAAELRTRSFESAVKVARGQLFPRLSLNGSVNTNYSSAASQNTLINTTDVQTTNYVIINGNNSPVFAKQNNFKSDKIRYSKQLNNNVFSSVSLNLSIPLFNNLFQRNRVKLAKLDVINQTLNEQTVKTGLQQDIERAHLNMATAFESYKTLITQVNAYKESFRAAEIRFNEGVGNSIDYLIAKNNLDRANSNLIIARYDYVLKTKILDYYQGKATW